MEVAKIGSELVSAGRLEKYPLCIYACDSIPDGTVHISKVDCCVSHAMFSIANEKGPSVYLGEGHLGGCCPGGQSWLGYIQFTDGLNFFISNGSPSYRNGAAEYLKRDPKITKRSIEHVGSISPPGRFIVVAPYHIPVEDGRILSILCFGQAEKVRNLIALAEFGSDEPFMTCIAPWGPACASMITYASGMSSNAPKGALIVGPSDPTVNEWLPPDMMTLSIPVAVAERMTDDVDASFLTKRPKVAFPEKRVPT